MACCGQVMKEKHPYQTFVGDSVQVDALRKVLIVVNPTSGNRWSLIVAKEVQEALKTVRLAVPDIAIDLRETQYAGHAQHITAGTNMAGYDALLSIGGDGTAHEVVNGMLLGVVLGVHPPHALPALCIVPCGSGNTVAYSIGYQTHEEAVQRLLARTTRALDVVELAHAPPTPQAGAEWLAA
ncbi:sgkB, partial [Symbiodinium sp. KB8]